ncbi:MAG: hypothetical protein P8X57_01930 [Cyclobacteriaceae bacterium]
MSFLNRLIQNKQGRLPLVRPRIASRFENIMPSVPEPDAAPNIARPLARPSSSDSHETGDPEQVAVSKNNSQYENLEYVSGEDILTPEKHIQPPLKNDSQDINQESASHKDLLEMEGGKAFVREDNDEAEGILIEQHYLKQRGDWSANSGKAKTDSRSLNSTSAHPGQKSRQNTGSAGESVIVNIGTVEVRAIVDQKEKPRRKSPERKPKMSLQEYLDKKNKRS